MNQEMNHNHEVFHSKANSIGFCSDRAKCSASRSQAESARLLIQMILLPAEANAVNEKPNN